MDALHESREDTTQQSAWPTAGAQAVYGDDMVLMASEPILHETAVFFLQEAGEQQAVKYQVDGGDNGEELARES